MKASLPKKSKHAIIGTDGNLTGATKEYVNGLDATIFKAQVKRYVARVGDIEKITHSIYQVVWAQCSPLIQEKLTAKDEVVIPVL